MKILFNSKIRPILFIALMLGVAAPVQSFDDGDLSAFTRRGMDMWHVPGMSVVVVRQDEILFQKSFGRTADDDGQAVNEHTLFAIASTTKAMVATAILMLSDEEELSLDDPVIEHIPELHFKNPMLTQQLTVRDLLAHRTGLPSTDFWTFFQNMPLDEQLLRLRNVPSEAPVRTRLIYQNTMFEIAGLLIERISGLRWDEFLTERLWRPLGMMETFGDRSQIGAGLVHVTPHLYLEGQLVVADWDFPADYADAAGSVWSSVHDMSLWAQFLLRDGVTTNGERLVSEEGMQAMFEPQQLASPGDFYPTVELTKPNWRSYGLGWFQQDFQGRKIDFHTGSLSGLIAIIGLDRAGDKAVVVLGNRDHAEMRHALMWHVMDKTAGGERRDWNQDIFNLYERLASETDKKWEETTQKRLVDTKPGLPPEAYAGHYRNSSFGDIRIEGSGPDMTLKTTLVDFEMSHWHLDTFLIEWEAWGIREFATFTIGPDGGIQSVDVMGHAFERISTR